MKHFQIIAGGILGALLAAPLSAQSVQGVLVELYTSQGCSSCPPADALLAQMAQDSSLIPLALHVDYWDYIGWKDTFAQEQFSKRQRKYAAFRGDRMVYTPQMIIAGGARVKGHDAAEARAAIAAASGNVTLVLQRDGEDVLVQASSAAALSGDYLIELVRYRPQSDLLIERGENRGLQARYHNIVTSWETIGRWNGREALTLRARAAGDAPIVVVVQHKGPSEVIAAAVLK
jgi:hypothetical protein